MDMNNGVNPAQSDNERAELSVESETVSYIREPPPPYSPPGDAAVTNQHIFHHIVIVQPPLKSEPMYYTCPVCQERVLTKVQFINTKETHMCAGFVCGFLTWCLLCCLAAIPYFIPTFKKAEHYCPNCDTLLGTYSRV